MYGSFTRLSLTYLLCPMFSFRVGVSWGSTGLVASQLMSCWQAGTRVMRMRMPRGGLTTLVGTDRSWDFSLECLQFRSRVMSDSLSTGMCGELLGSPFGKQNTPALV
ncbi:hypothetical protein BgiMline_005695 [Biomphalaria glabrata]|nr:hypothetical protein BgiMline_003705 [Biomphalaria glabrata]